MTEDNKPLSELKNLEGATVESVDPDHDKGILMKFEEGMKLTFLTVTGRNLHFVRGIADEKNPDKSGMKQEGDDLSR